jgi:hypothetical protein
MLVERFGLKQGKIADLDVNKRNDAFVNRFPAALTIAAKGEVILVTESRNSRFGGSGAYSMPDPKTAKENVWRTYEFPLAQRNPDVTRVVSYALDEDPMIAVVDWEPGKKGEPLPEPSFSDPPLRKMIAAPGPLGPLGPETSKPKPGDESSRKPAPGPLGPLDLEPLKPKPQGEPSRNPLRGPFSKPVAVRRQEFILARRNQ